MAITRRNFVSSLSAAVTAPYFFTSAKPAWAQERSKNDRVPIGLIGAGGMGNGNMRSAKRWLDVVAIADVDKRHRDGSNQRLSKGNASVYSDYRKILDRDDIKVVHIATPDHWHSKILVEAMQAGKDVYCEKPLTLTIDEGKLIRKVQKETGRIVQVGTQQRSTFHLFTKAIAIVQEGRLGKLRRMQAAIGAAPACDAIAATDVPSQLDWDTWVGPAPTAEYRSARQEKTNVSNCHSNFRWWYEYSGGKLTDWGAHHVDICMWALKANGQSDDLISIGGTAKHPVEYKDGMPVQIDRYNTATEFAITAKFPDDVELLIRHDTRNGVLLEGDKGRIFVSRGKLSGAPVEQLKDKPLAEDSIKKAYKNLPMQANERAAHWANFLHCVETRNEPISDVHSHMRMLNVCHLAGISARLGRDLTWDAENEQITGDEQANGFLKRPYRKGFEIEIAQPV